MSDKGLNKGDNGKRASVSRRRFLGLATAGSIGLVAAACSTPAAPAPTAAPQPAAKGGKVQFVGWIHAEKSGVSSWELMQSGFAKKHAGWTVENLDVPYENMAQQVMVMGTGGNPPDVAQCVAPWTAAWGAADLLEPLDSLVPQDTLKDFVQTPGLGAGTINGKLLSLPWAMGTHIPVWNRTLMQKANLDPDKSPTTIQEFEDTLAAIAKLDKDKDGNKIWPMAAHTLRDAMCVYRFLPWLWGNGGDITDDKGNFIVNDQITIDTLTWYASLSKRGWMTKGIGTRDCRQLFSKDLAGMETDGPWVWGIMRDISGKGKDFDNSLLPAAYPKGKAGKSEAIVYSHHIVLFKGSKAKEGALNFMQFVTGDPEVTQFYNEQLGMIAPRQSLLKNAVFQNKLNKVYAETVLGGRTPRWSHPKFEAALDPIAVAIQAAVIDGKDAKAALDEAAKSAKAIVGQA